jgi:predicted permease
MIALRRLWRAPAFSIPAVGVLALGLAAALAVLEVGDSVLLRPLPYAESERLVTAWQVSGGTRITLDGADFLDWSAERAAFAETAAVSARGFTLAGADAPERVDGAIVTSSFFGLLGTPPLRGQVPAAGERAAMLSESLWRSRFEADPRVVGSTVRLDGEPVRVAGVMPARFEYPPLARIWVTPRGRVPEHPTYPIDPEHDRARHYLTVLARLAPGVTLERADAALRTVQARIAADHPDEEKDVTAQLLPLREQLIGNVRPLLFGLLGMAALLLCVAWASAAHLFVARAVAHAHESAVRIALGATRGALWRLFFSEAFVVSLLAGALGLALAAWVAPWLVHLSPTAATLPAIELSARVAGAALLLAVLCGASLGLAAVIHPLRLADVLKEDGRTAGGSVRQARLRSAFLVFEVALSLVLLVSAGLLFRSLSRVASVDPGFRPAGVLAADLPLAKTRYPDKAAQLRFAQDLLRRLRADPLVEDAGVVSRLPFSPSNTVGDLALPGRENEAFPCDLRLASDGYFETLHVPLRAGRTFTEPDFAAGAAPAVILNEAAARRAFPNGSAIGQKVLVWGEATPSEVIGIVGDVHHLGLEAQPRPEAWRAFGAVGWPNLMLVVRGKVPAAQLTAPLRAAVAAIDPEQPIVHPEPLEARIGASLSLRRFTVTLLSVAAIVAALLAAAGVYGVTVYLVAARTRELGVRMALGATSARVASELVRETMARVAVGCLAGLFAAAVLARVLRGFLFDVQPLDPATFVVVPLALAATAAAATLLGALRAARLQPAEALRT